MISLKISINTQHFRTVFEATCICDYLSCYSFKQNYDYVKVHILVIGHFLCHFIKAACQTLEVRYQIVKFFFLTFSETEFKSPTRVYNSRAFIELKHSDSHVRQSQETQTVVSEQDGPPVELWVSQTAFSNCLSYAMQSQKGICPSQDMQEGFLICICEKCFTSYIYHA